MIIDGRKGLHGEIKAPPSKSVMHRELIVSFLCSDRSHLDDMPGDSDDIKATRACLRSVAQAVPGQDVILDCNESGSTIRFMIPVACALLLRKGHETASSVVFRTKGRLFDRPFDELADAMRPNGIEITKDESTRSIIAKGSMSAGIYTIDGSVSSQYISGLLMALPLFDEESRIVVTGDLKSVHYIGLTTDVLAKYGAPAKFEDSVFTPSCGGYPVRQPGPLSVEGDWSNGAFLLCLARYCGINVTGLSMDSKQGDRAILDFLKLADSASSDASAEWDCTDTPDIAPYMAVVSAFSFGKMVLKGTGRLRIKESDRVMAVREQLLAAGVKTEETEDTLTIFGYSRTEGYEEPLKLSSYHDHRMAMCAILIAVILKVKVGIDDTECLNKSFPELREMIGKEMT